MPPQVYLVVGAVLGGLGVATGALGAHALKSLLSAEQLGSFETAVRYQIFHALAMVLVGLVSATSPSRAGQTAGVAFLTGVLLFSGGIYAWLFTGTKAFAHIVPVGGVAFLVGWIALAIAGWHYSFAT